MKVFLIWGLWGFIFSRGLNAISKTLLGYTSIETEIWAKGIVGYLNRRRIVASCVAAAQAGKRIVLIGHSMGGVMATMVAQDLAAVGIKVELIILFDACPPSHVQPIGSNVKAVLNIYRSGIGLNGESLKGKQAAGYKGDLEERHVTNSHGAIEDDPYLQEVAVLAAVRRAA